MAESIAERILADVQSKIESITIANGYNTDLGLNSRGIEASQDLQSMLERGQDPFAIVSPGSETQLEIMTWGARRNALTINVTFATAIDPMPIVSDLKVALFTDVTFGSNALDSDYVGWTRSSNPEMSATVYEFSMSIDYEETLADPY